jgi:hypothetical protein
MAEDYYANYPRRSAQPTPAQRRVVERRPAPRRPERLRPESRRPDLRRRKKKSAKSFFTIAFMGMAAFAVGFVALWYLGGWIVGGRGSGGQSAGLGDSVIGVPFDQDSEIEPLIDMVAFRDLAYTPVLGVHVYADRAGNPYRDPAKNNTTYMERIISVADWSEINAIVITVKADGGVLAYDANVPLAEGYGSIRPSAGIGDIDALLAILAEHDIIPIARITCFKDSFLARRRSDLAIQTETGGVWADPSGDSYLNPYNHEVWEYLTQVAEDVASRGFREIQFDYVRFPDRGIATAVYPGQYCSKEDAIAGFLAYARPRLEALGVWVSADVFGMSVKASDDNNIGQQFEKICQNVDIILPMVYPSAWWPGSYNIEYPPAEPYNIIRACMSDAARRLEGTGAKGRPYLQASDDYLGRNLPYGPFELTEQVRAAEELGFNEWIYWGGYLEAALRPAADGGYSPTTTVPSVTTTESGQ